MIKIKVFCFRLFNYLVRYLMHFMWRGSNTWHDVCGGVKFAERQLFPENVKLDIKRLSPYFSAYGYKVPLSYGEAYAKWTGIASDRYMSMDVYYQYAIPALNRYDFIRQTSSSTRKSASRSRFCRKRFPIASRTSAM